MGSLFELVTLAKAGMTAMNENSGYVK